MKYCLETGYVPTSRVVPIVERAYAENRQNPGEDRQLNRWKHQDWAAFDSVDRKFCELGIVEAWHSELADIYQAVNLECGTPGFKPAFTKNLRQACEKGHPLVPGNITTNRRCRTCKRHTDREYARRKTEATRNQAKRILDRSASL